MSTHQHAFAEREALLLLADIAGALAAIHGKSPIQIAEFFDDFYALCDAQVAANGGHVVKYLGDSSLALFDAGEASAALNAAQNIRDQFPQVCQRNATQADVRFNLHQGKVIHGRFGSGQIEDVLGGTVNTLFTMPSSRGYSISERVYRLLPSDARAPWQKRTTPVVYTRD